MQIWSNLSNLLNLKKYKNKKIRYLIKMPFNVYDNLNVGFKINQLIIMAYKNSQQKVSNFSTPFQLPSFTLSNYKS